ncbi:MAG TPA: metallophosphoesterase [Saprospiraceae bacterium]|nr:metallophosphoesterase [Saprospiraceae bacterium]
MDLKDKLKILWISDIHFSMDYLKFKPFSEKHDLCAFDFIWNSFVTETNKHEFTHLIISGDLLMGGKVKERENFSNKLKELLAKIQERTTSKHVNGIPIIIYPGNHDVNWDSLVIHFNSYLTRNKDKLKEKGGINILKTYLEEKFFDLKKAEIFKEFGSLYFDLREFNLVGKDFYNHKDDWNYALDYYDSEYNVLFRIYNSSINSHGDGVKEIIEVIGEAVRDKIGDDKWMEWLVDIVTIFKEQGNQVYLQSPEISKWQEQISISDPLVISCAHHPLEWLQYNMLYDGNIDAPIPLLKKYSNLHLTSHEHINPAEYFNYSSEGVLMLKSGKFCDRELIRSPSEHLTNNQLMNEIFTMNWYSVIDIDKVDGNLEVLHNNYKFEYISFNNHFWKNISPEKRHVLYNKQFDKPVYKFLNEDISSKNLDDLIDLYEHSMKDFDNWKKSILREIDSKTAK